MLISVLSTCYQNATTLSEFVDRIRNALEPIRTDFEIVLVDDGSTDDSWEIIEHLASRYSFVRGVRLSRNFGQHPAILAGLDEVRGDVTVLIDSDLDDDPDLIPLVVQPILQGHFDIVLTVQPANKKRLLSMMFHLIVARSTKIKSDPAIATFRGFSLRVVESLRMYRDHSTVFGPLSTQIGFRTKVVELPTRDSPRNASRYNLSRRIRLAWPILVNEVGLLVKLVLSLMTCVFLLALALGFFAASRFVANGGDLMSTTSLVYYVLVINQVLLGLGLGLVALYLRSILTETLKRPRFHVLSKTESQRLP